MNSSKIAEDLLKIKAVTLQLDPPYTWSSGWRSPIYCDNRLTLSYPEVRKNITANFVEQLRRKYPDADGIVGVATGAIALGAMVATALDLPMIYIRSKPKGHGMKKLIEGHVNPQGKYVIIEDLVSTGKSSIQAVKAVQESGATVLGTIAIFSYGFPQADEKFQATGTAYHSLTNLSTLLEKATEIDYLRPEDRATILSWQQQPETWRQE
ncbi:MAG: orotate phosphoribosyltransferase [Bacteroidota bacterium]